MQTYEEISFQDARGPSRRQRLEDLWAGFSDRRRDYLIAAGLFLIVFIVYLPFRARYLTNWDSVNYALGMGQFSIENHQPHPPGYIGYIYLARLVRPFMGDANGALTLLSAFGGAVATAFVYLLLREFVPRRASLITTALFATSPLVVYYSLIALSYVVGAAAAVAVAWLCLRAYRERRPALLYWAATAFAVLGALRQTDMALLFLLLLFASWPFGWGVRIRAAVLFTALTALWLFPLIYLSWGWQTYMLESRWMADSAGYYTHVLELRKPFSWRHPINLHGYAFLRNSRFVMTATILGIGAGFPVAAMAVARRINPLALLRRHESVFLGLWAIPPLLTFLLIHTGQFGYMLLILPVFYVIMGVCLGALQRRREQRSAARLGAAVGSLRQRMRGAVPVTIVLALLTVNFFGQAWFSRGVYGLMTTSYKPIVRPIAPVLMEDPPTMEYDRVAGDAFWDELLRFVHQFEPDHTLVLTFPWVRGTFRFMSYYLKDDYTVYGLWIREGDLGQIFTAKNGEVDYRLPWRLPLHYLIPIPPGVDKIVITDPWIATRLDEDIPRDILELPQGAVVVVVKVPPGAEYLHFRPWSNDRRSGIEYLTRDRELFARLMDELGETGVRSYSGLG